MEKEWVVYPKVNGDLREQLLSNRGIKDLSSAQKFLKPFLTELSEVGLQLPQIDKAVERIKKAIKNKELIYVYGDFDVDGITGTAILWETIDYLQGRVLPYIPHRETEGYGLHTEALEKLSKEGAKMVISVDCGITAVEQAKIAKRLGVDLIITDHHEPQEELPSPFALLHTTKLAGSGVAFRLAEALLESSGQDRDEQFFKNLELAAIGTVADMVPLVGENRIIVKNGLPLLSKSERLGLKSLYEQASISKSIGSSQIGFIIAPRLNAMGRMEHALDSLRLLLTRKPERARSLAVKLSSINEQRQKATEEALTHARGVVEKEFTGAKMFILDHESYQQGVVGLVAGKIVEEYYRPTAVISVGHDVSKGSARSVSGFHITNALKVSEKYLEAFGGHPMAAGFSILPEKIGKFREKMVKHAESTLTKKDLTPTLKIDTEIDPEKINSDTRSVVEEFEPFGIGNPEPTFLTKNFEVLEARTVGAAGKHLKLLLKTPSQPVFDAIWFSFKKEKPEKGSRVDVVYNLLEDFWNGRRRLQIKVKDLRESKG
ncbi:MAG: single-stranded-DNA-specific exonuclease RecJ [Candidatus Woykebacteria bacterium]